MEARGESRGVLGAAMVVWEDRSYTAAPRQPSLSQTNRCLLRALQTAGRGLLCPVPSDTLCPAPAACFGAFRPLPCQDAGWGGRVLKDERAEADHTGDHRCCLSCVECGPAAWSCGPTKACQGVVRRKWMARAPTDERRTCGTTFERGIRPALSLFWRPPWRRGSTPGRAPFGPPRADQDTSWRYRYLQ